MPAGKTVCHLLTITRKCAHHAQGYAHTHTQKLSYSTKLSVTVIPKDKRGTWSARSFPDLAQLLCLTSTEQCIKHFCRQKRAMWHISISKASIRHKFKGQITTRLPLILCPFPSKGMYLSEQATANLLVTHVIQVCCESPFKKKVLIRCIPTLSSINQTLKTLCWWMSRRVKHMMSIGNASSAVKKHFLSTATVHWELKI